LLIKINGKPQMKKYLILISVILCILAANAQKYLDPDILSSGWHSDILKDGYEARYVNLGKTYDGNARCTIIRKLCREKSKKAILYIHGFNDYFFQSEMGNRFVDSCYNFYAVDLRRYGRSLLPWQYPFDIRNFNEYMQEIDSAVNQIHHDGIHEIILFGHSTGGLTTAYYAAKRGARSAFKAAMCDSPFLAWNFSPLYRKVLIPAVGFWGRIFKTTKIPQAHCDGYAYSLLKQYFGDWEYNTDWKMVYSPAVTAAWVNAVSSAQKHLMRHGADITIPILVLHSDRKISGCQWSPDFQTGDAVLDPEQLHKRGMKLGHNPQVITIPNGMHNLILSSDTTAREAAYDAIFSFLRKI